MALGKMDDGLERHSHNRNNLHRNTIVEYAMQLKALQRALGRIQPRADGNYNASDFDWALEEAIKDAENTEHDEMMGEFQ